MKHNLNVVLGCYSLMLSFETAPEVDLKINRSSLGAYTHIHKSIAPVFFFFKSMKTLIYKDSKE